MTWATINGKKSLISLILFNGREGNEEGPSGLLVSPWKSPHYSVFMCETLGRKCVEDKRQ